MKNTILTISVIALIMGLSMVSAYIYQRVTYQPPVGSVNIGGEYNHSTSTVSAEDSFMTFSARTRIVLASTTPAGFPIKGDENLPAPILGSLIITSSSPTLLRIYNATSTTDIGSSTIACIGTLSSNPNVRAEIGTYVFDMVMNRGIVLDFDANFSGSYTFTWKQ